MKNVYKVDAVRLAEKQTMEIKNIKEIELMKTAGDRLTEDFLDRVKPNKSEAIFVVAGIGNNGGDALVMRNNLKQMGYKVSLIIIGNREKATASFKYYFDESDQFMDICNEDDIYVFRDDILEADIIIDGIFGIGLKRNVENLFKDVIEAINGTKKPIYSVDIMKKEEAQLSGRQRKYLRSLGHSRHR